MAIALESLRVTAEMDATAYARGASIKVAADAQMVESDRRRNASMAQAQAAMERSIPGFNSLAKNLLQGYTAGQQFERQIRSVSNALGEGMHLDTATIMLDNLYRKFGLVADAAVLARQGFVNIVPTISAMNAAVATYEERIRRADLVTRAFAEAQALLSRQAANQNQMNKQLGVNLAGNDGAAKASADAFLQEFGGLEGVAKTKAQQIGAAFTAELNGRLVGGIKSSAQQSASAWDSLFDQMDTIAAARAAHFADQVQLGWSEAFNMNGADRKSAQASAAIFSAAIAEAEKAGAKAGGAFAAGMREASQAEKEMTIQAERLRAQINPLETEMVALGKQMANYRNLLREGHISSKEFENAQAMAAKRLGDVDQNLRKAATAGRVMSGEMANLGYQVNDVVTGLMLGQSPFMIFAQQGGQIYQIFQHSKASIADFAKSSATWFGSLFTASRVAFGGIAAGVLFAVSALISFQSKQSEVQRQLAGMGRASGATAGSIDVIAQQSSSSTGFSVNEARNLATALAATGKVGVEAIGPIVKLGHDFAVTYGVSAKEATEMLASAFADPVKGAEELNKRLGFLDANTRLLIESLVVQGDRQQAVRILTDAVATSIVKASDVTSLWAQAWTITGNAASAFFDSIGRGMNRALNNGDGIDEMLGNITTRIIKLQAAKADGSGKSVGFFDDFGDFAKSDGIDEELTALLAKMEQLQATKRRLTAMSNSGGETADKQRGLEIDAIARASAPAIEQTRKLEDQTKALSEAFNNPAIGKWVTIVGTDLVRALQRSDAAAKASKGFDPVTNQIADAESQIRLLDQRTIADKARAAADAERRRQQSDPNAGTSEERNRKIGLAALQAAGGQTALDNAEKSRIGTLGVMATVTDQVRMKQLDLTEAGRTGSGVSEKQSAVLLQLARDQALGTAAIKAQIDSVNVQSATVGMGAGAAAEYAAKQTIYNEALRAHKELAAEDVAEIEKQAKALGKAVQAAAELSLVKQIKFDGDTTFLSDTDKSIASILRQTYGDDKWQSMMDGPIAGALRYNAVLKQVADLASTAASGIARDFASGVPPMEALAKAAKNVAESVLDIAAKKIVGNVLGDMLGNTAAQTAGATTSAGILTSAGTTVAAAMIAGATEAAGILGLTVPTAAAALPVAGALTGTEVAVGGAVAGTSLAAGGAAAGMAMWGPIALLMAAVAAIGGLSMFGGGDEKKKQEAARIQALNNRATLAGIDQTTLEGKLMAFDLNANVERTALPNGGRTERSWTNALTFGLFGDSGGEQSQESIALERALAAERIAVIEDFNKKAIETEKQRVEAATKMMNDAVAMLKNVQLSDTAERLKDIQTASGDLMTALGELGMSTESVAAQVKSAMDDLRKTFTDSLTARLNSALGRGYINDTLSLMNQRNQDLQDAASIGLSDYQVGIVFRAEAQKIINDAGLVGDSFKEFISLFPELAGVVSEASDDVEAAVRQQQEALNSSAKSIVDYVNGVTAGSASTLSPGDRLAAAQAQYSAKLVLAQAGNIDAQNSISDDAENLRSAARDMYGSTAGYQTILDTMKSQLLALPAVQQATDPVVLAMRDVLLAVQATKLSVDGTELAIGTLQGALVAALAINSPSAIASAFLSSGAAGLTFPQFKAGFPPGLATDEQLRSVYDATIAAGNVGLTFAQFKAGFPEGLATDAALQAVYDATIASGNSGLTFAQFKAGFPAGLATDSTLLGLYTKLDTNKNGIVSQLELLQAALKPAIDSGNAASIAAALSTYFNLIATNTDAGISLPDMQVALAGMASVGALRDMFTRLDTDASGSLDRLELIKNASQSTSAFSANAAYYTQQSTIILDYANSLSGSANSIANAAYGLLASINGLQSTASQQLTLLTTQYGSAITSIPGSIIQNLGNITANNTVMSALNKIALNTYAISMNTAYIGQSGYRGWNYTIGTYAQGGWITGGTPGVDSVPLNNGRALGMPGEFVVERSVAQANKDWLPSFNSGRGIPIPTISGSPSRAEDNNSSREVLTELRELRKELAAIKSNTGRTISAVVAGAEHVRQGVDNTNSKMEDANKMARRG